MRLRQWIIALALVPVTVAIIISGLSLADVADEATVTVNPQIRYQTILGWGAPAGLFWLPDQLVDEIIEESVNGLGLTRLRFEPPRREWEDVLNDDGDPYHIRWEAFKTARTDAFVAKILLPFKGRVEANGEHFSLYVSPSFFDGGSSGSAPAWLLYSPAEYAEWASAMLIYLRDKHKIVADYYCICNEAGNNNAFTPIIVGEMIKELGRRMKSLGIPTKIQFPECVNANMSWDYIRALEKDEEVWSFIGLVSYHLYGNNSARPQIRDFAWKRGLPTGQTEFMGLTVNHLYDDLTLGGVSYWEFYALNDYLRVNPSRTWFSHTPSFWEFRQIIRYVRPDSVRIEAISSDPNLRCLAFTSAVCSKPRSDGKVAFLTALHFVPCLTTNFLSLAASHEAIAKRRPNSLTALHFVPCLTTNFIDGKVTVVLLNNVQPSIQRTVKVKGMPPGTYGISWSVRGSYHEGGLRQVDDTGEIVVDVPANAVLTIYPHQGNLPPVLIDWHAEPSFLTLPSNRVTLVASAVDPEQRELSYRWTILAQPHGASVTILAPNSPKTQAIGLSVAGNYTFAVAVSDGVNMTVRRIHLTVYDGNQPPEIIDLHNRLPVTVTLPTSSTTLRGGGQDLEGDPLTFRWSIVSQPPGANAILETPDKPSCVVRNLTIAGDYIFRFHVSDPTHTVTRDLKVTVYPENAPPVIEKLSSEPPSLKLPASTAILSAQTVDPDGDVVTHWWSVKASPYGAKPIIEKPGSPVTVVKGLSVPGKYVFTLTAIDRTKVVRQDVSVIVQP